MMKTSESHLMPETSSVNQEIMSQKSDKCRHQCMEEEIPNSEAPAASSNFDCNICLESSQDPVVTMCGHLFCWSCLYRWLTVHSISKECPVCKAGVQDKVIPLYGRGKIGFTNPGTKSDPGIYIPHRPLARRTDIAAPARRPAPSFQNHGIRFHENHIGGAGHTAFSAGLGLFPSLFGLQMTEFPEYSSGFSSGTAYTTSFRSPASSSMMTQQWRLNNRQDFVLYWLFILLAFVAMSFFLLF